MAMCGATAAPHAAHTCRGSKALVVVYLAFVITSTSNDVGRHAQFPFLHGLGFGTLATKDVATLLNTLVSKKRVFPFTIYEPGELHYLGSCRCRG